MNISECLEKNTNTLICLQDDDKDWRIESSGLYKIYRAIDENFDIGMDSYKLYWDTIEKFDLHLVTKQGKILKRVAKLIKEKYDLDILKDSRFMGSLGDVVRDNTIKNEVFLDFTQEFDWYSGQFGDRGSCFWGGRSDAKNKLMSLGAYAMRTFYDDNYSNSNGRSRLWLFPLPKHHGFMLMNSYGLSLGEHANILHRFLESKKVTHYQNPMRFAINGSDSGLIWINGGSGILFSDHDYSCLTSINYKNDTLNDLQECYNCGRTINIDDGDYALIDGEYYCDDCFAVCAHCGEANPIENLESFGFNYYCESCYNELFTECEICGCVHDRDDLSLVIYNHTEILICSMCLDDFDICIECNEITKHAKEFNGDIYCESCYDEYIHTCDNCGSEFYSEYDYSLCLACDDEREKNHA